MSACVCNIRINICRNVNSRPAVPFTEEEEDLSPYKPVLTCFIIYTDTQQFVQFLRYIKEFYGQTTDSGVCDYRNTAVSIIKENDVSLLMYSTWYQHKLSL